MARLITHIAVGPIGWFCPLAYKVEWLTSKQAANWQKAFEQVYKARIATIRPLHYNLNRQAIISRML